MSISEHNPSVAILASGSGSTAEAFIHATQDGRVDAEVGLVVCNKPPEKAGIYARIERLKRQYGLDIEVAEIGRHNHPGGDIGRGQTLAESLAICELVTRRRVTHVALMGYMLKVQGALLDQYGWHPSFASPYLARMSNTHPGPLPETLDTWGIHTSRKVLELGLTASRHTFQLVAAGMDEGPICAEHPVEVKKDDTAEDLFERHQVVEKVALPYALDKFLREQREYNEMIKSLP